MNFKTFISRHFAGCICLAQTRDEHRNRQVSVFALPGEFEYVGVSDGTDAWIAPVAADPFSVNIKKRLEEMARGELHLTRSRERRALPAELDDQPTGRQRHALPAGL